MFGLLTFLLNFIPTIGSIIATLLPLPIVLLQFDSPVKWLVVILIPAAIQGIVGNFIEPKLFSDSLDLHPASILLALTFWGIIWGPVGMFLAVPIIVVLKIAMARIPATRPIAELMAGRLPFGARD
jgi:AI-2 transport protein TqsA